MTTINDVVPAVTLTEWIERLDVDVKLIGDGGEFQIVLSAEDSNGEIQSPLRSPMDNYSEAVEAFNEEVKILRRIPTVH